ncbi:hypothetical protein PXO_02663 [Xanthomonas oryzae pv. oryzae PXO99A]|uniref:Uncharacterized protein n=1 Tax=Xanthomonas oryzae pv. oryzae (strain PXO99A) TaxID=360094 RepID=A0A0K0GPZ2_XANOP|nr:hypothetical protein PXO_02663 [Xanthomonas oryzae pv. oryzae PXO99A]
MYRRGCSAGVVADRMRRVSMVGVALCLLYLAATAFCVWGALSAQGDPKG